MCALSRVGLFALVGLLLVAAGARGQDKKIALDKVPKPVLDAVKAKYPGAELKSAEEDKEDGKTLYEVALTFKQLTLDVKLTPDGKFVEIEKAISAKDLPRAVTAVLDSKYPKATINKAEEVTKGDQVGYEVGLVTADNKKVGLELDAKGKILEEKIKEEKKSDKK